MLRLEKQKNTKNITYFYFPENNSDFGVIEVNNKNEVKIISESLREKEIGSPYYAKKARTEILQMLKENYLVENKFFYWY